MGVTAWDVSGASALGRRLWRCWEMRQRWLGVWKSCLQVRGIAVFGLFSACGRRVGGISSLSLHTCVGRSLTVDVSLILFKKKKHDKIKNNGKIKRKSKQLLSSWRLKADKFRVGINLAFAPRRAVHRRVLRGEEVDSVSFAGRCSPGLCLQEFLLTLWGSLCSHP